MLRIQIPASTANIGPGYDTFGLALNLYNYVNVLPGRNPHKLTFTIAGEKTRALADARHNLVV
ncbi:MAG: homoserine kinase, partial [Christensenellaceae bacterium]|nr:homoserine kinase [Christensenellaceae bacterium]